MSEATATPRGDSASAIDPFLPPADFRACGIWKVAHVKSRMEKAFAEDLARDHIPVFIPLTSRISFATGQSHIVREPLFYGYVFFAGDDEAVRVARETRRLVMVIPVVNQSRLITDLEKIRSAMQADPGLGTRSGLLAGSRCRIVGGPLQGCEGFVESNGPRRSIVVVRIDILGQSVACDLPEDQLEAA